MSFNILIEKMPLIPIGMETVYRIRTQYGSDIEESIIQHYINKWIIEDFCDQAVYSIDEIDLKFTHFGAVSCCYLFLTKGTEDTELKLEHLEYALVGKLENITITFKGF